MQISPTDRMKNRKIHQLIVAGRVIVNFVNQLWKKVKIFFWSCEKSYEILQLVTEPPPLKICQWVVGNYHGIPQSVSGKICKIPQSVLRKKILNSSTNRRGGITNSSVDETLSWFCTRQLNDMKLFSGALDLGFYPANGNFEKEKQESFHSWMHFIKLKKIFFINF